MANTLIPRYLSAPQISTAPAPLPDFRDSVPLFQGRPYVNASRRKGNQRRRAVLKPNRAVNCATYRGERDPGGGGVA